MGTVVETTSDRRMEAVKEIEKSRQRIENWSKDFQSHIKIELERFSLYVNDQCQLHQYRIHEELNNLQTRLLPQLKSISNHTHENIAAVSDNESEEDKRQSVVRKRRRNPTTIYSPESQKRPRGRPRKSLKDTPNDKNHLLEDVETNQDHLSRQSTSSRRSTRKKSHVSYIYSDNEVSDASQEKFPSPSNNCHQLLSSLSSSHFLSYESALPLPPVPTVLPLMPTIPVAASPQSDLLKLYQTYVINLLQHPSPHKYQFRHYQDIYYLWGGYYQSRPFAMSFKLIVDFLHFFSDQNSYDGKSNTRLMRQAIYNLLRSGDLVLLDSVDESSVFVPLDDDKECIPFKYMIALPLSQIIVEEHQESDQEIIDELVTIYYEIYWKLVALNHKKKSEGEALAFEDENYVNVIDIQNQFLTTIQSGKCQKLCERYQQTELKDENISWEFYIPPNEHWKMYRRYEMVDINLFYKYLESKHFAEIFQTKAKVQYLLWIHNECDDEEELDR